MKPLPRCINLDWLEVAALEPIDEPHDADFFRACGCVVIEREYGTRVWAQMFTIEGEDHLPFMEVRRCPKSEIIEPNIVHLRLVNRVCYFPHAASIMAGFLEEYRYDFHHICRVDVCSDFEKFDYGDDPKAFMRRFMEDVTRKSTKQTYTPTAQMIGQAVCGTRCHGVRHHQMWVPSSTTRPSSYTTQSHSTTQSHTFGRRGRWLGWLMMRPRCRNEELMANSIHPIYGA